MSLLRDRQLRRYALFLLMISSLMAAAGLFLLAASVPASCACLLSVWIAGEWAGWPLEAGGMAVYLLLCVLLAGLLKWLAPDENILCAAAAVWLLGSLVLCGSGIRFDALLPEAGLAARLFPPYYYLSFFP